MLDPKFWKQSKTRFNNPTYSSKLIQSSIFIDGLQKDNSKQNADQFRRIKRSYSAIDVQNSYVKTNQAQKVRITLPLIKIRNNNQDAIIKPDSGSKVSKISENVFLKKNKLPVQTMKVNLQNMKREISSFFSSSREIFQKQQHNYDIIQGLPKKVRSEMNLFPKLHLQRLDNQYKKRQAFLKGDLKVIRKLRQTSLLKQKSNLSNKYLTQSNHFTALRRIQPVQRSFKITQNPEIISKKLIMQK